MDIRNDSTSSDRVDPAAPAGAAEVLARAALLTGVPQDAAAMLVNCSPSRHLGEGEVLLTRGQENRTLFLVLEGSLAVHLGGPRDAAHARAGPGECVGELSVVDGHAVSADVIATGPARVLAIDRDALWAAIDASPVLARNLLAILSGRVRQNTHAIADAARLQHVFQQAATVDGLTGLRNRRWMDETFTRQLERTLHEGRAASLMMLDVDGFKRLNDAHGHLVGDATLCRIARVLSDHLRPQDLLARYGGDEFTLLLPDADIEEAVRTAERLRAAVAAAVPDPQYDPLPPATVSIGVATARLSNSLHGLIAAADAALYRAKEGGRNKVSR
jgi:diguanylate cyclase (GGDEF)-like protein